MIKFEAGHWVAYCDKYGCKSRLVLETKNKRRHFANREAKAKGWTVDRHAMVFCPKHI